MDLSDYAAMTANRNSVDRPWEDHSSVHGAMRTQGSQPGESYRARQMKDLGDAAERAGKLLRRAAIMGTKVNPATFFLGEFLRGTPTVDDATQQQHKEQYSVDWAKEQEQSPADRTALQESVDESTDFPLP